MVRTFLKAFPLAGFVFIFQAAAVAQDINPYTYKTIKEKNYEKYAVSCAHPIASEVGAYILKKGGNAFDAAIAMQWALAVVYPGAGNIGGGGFLVAHTKDGKTLALDYREKAPGKASRDMYLDPATGNPITRLSLFGALAAGVPGTPSGLYESHKYARLPMATLIQPAIDLAEKGYSITEREASNLNGARAEFLKNNTYQPAFVKLLPWKAGDTLIQKELAGTLRLIRNKGLRGFYRGATATHITRQMQESKGIISKRDLRKYRSEWRQPVQFSYRGYDVITMPPASSGGILLAQMLKTLERYPLSTYGYNSADAVQLITEVERRAYADRAMHLGDPAFYKVPMKGLVDSAYLSLRMADYVKGVAGKSTEIKAGPAREHEETTHLSVVDAEGNAVSVNTTINGGYGSHTVVKGAGFLLNNEMDDLSVKPGSPNMFGAVGAEANSVAPGKRPLSSMTPTILLKNAKPFMVVGTPGGTTIITSVLQSILNVVDFNLSPGQAVNGPKFHHQWLPDLIMAEESFNKSVITRLEQMGYKFQMRSQIGRVEMIVIDPLNGKITAVADGRGDDSVAGE